MRGKSGLRLRPSKGFGLAGLQTLRSTIVPPGIRWCLESIAWEISKATSGGNTRCRLYIDRGNEKQFLDEQLNPVDNWLYTRNENDWLYPGERLALEIDEGQAATKATLNATGYREVCKE
ncbi:hypothetical protein LCGC14_0758400 [marine sediment metagenome]|uniref:Uncharacterized protein n=1 Tax=marine sediment metagenome TaxID=412755 RepID=A0A0F9T922_9ZZZZ